jgi:hypothetical protein
MLELRAGADPAFQITQGVTKDDWDKWVEERESHVEQVRNRGWEPGNGVYSNDVTSLLYGFVDLASYGQWVMLPGYGSGWVPNVGVGWAPYTYGRWCWYPGYGYTWISSEPWGWMPYHFGQWIYQPGYGWCWIPTNLNVWSPALVSWYRGPGWIGWVPAGSHHLAGGSPGCQAPQGCAATVSDETFRDGRPVYPARIRGIDPTVEGRLVSSPDIDPDRLGRLPGDPYRRPGVAGFEGGSRQGSVPQRGQITIRSLQGGSPAPSAAERQLSPTTAEEPRVRTRTSSGGIVFDPEQRQYINADEPAKPASTAPGIQPQPPSETGETQMAPSSAPSASAVTRESRPVGSLIGAHRPGPQGNYPSHAIGPQLERGAGAGNSISVSPGVRSSEGGADSRGAGAFIGIRDAGTGEGGSSGSSSVGRHAEGSRSRSDSVPRSGVSVGGERGAGSSIGIRSGEGSSRTSGGWTGGSRGSTGGAGGQASRGPGGSSGGRSTSSAPPPPK